jgi:hypothetical protein
MTLANLPHGISAASPARREVAAKATTLATETKPSSCSARHAWDEPAEGNDGLSVPGMNVHDSLTEVVPPPGNPVHLDTLFSWCRNLHLP